MYKNRVIENIIQTGTREKTAFFALLGILLVFAFLYAYFVNQTVINIVARKDVQTRIVNLSSELSGLEFEYMKYKNTITLDYTRALGFHDAKNTIFISRNTSGDKLTLQE